MDGHHGRRRWTGYQADGMDSLHVLPGTSASQRRDHIVGKLTAKRSKKENRPYHPRYHHACTRTQRTLAGNAGLALNDLDIRSTCSCSRGYSALIHTELRYDSRTLNRRSRPPARPLWYPRSAYRELGDLCEPGVVRLSPVGVHHCGDVDACAASVAFPQPPEPKPPQPHFGAPTVRQPPPRHGRPMHLA